jgi:heme ABC exporter ATP-binding subunit CcmA
MVRSTDTTSAAQALFGEDNVAVEIVEFTVRLDRVTVLGGINLRLLIGETLALMGPNGAGKSTLLKCLAGAIRPNGGQIRWFGGLATRSPVVRRRIGFIGHEFGLYRELTAAENLIFAGRMYGVERPAERADELLVNAGLEWAANRAVGKLSQGTCRRIAIARALMHDPQLILLDEPFASLDEGGTVWLEQLFDQWRHEARTVCFASHDARQNRELAHRTIRLQRGLVAECELGIAPSLISRPLMSRRSA